MYKRILCPIDGSPSSKLGIKEAVSIAKNQKAQLCFLHVIDKYFPLPDPSGYVSLVNIEKILHENGQKILNDAKDYAKKSHIKAESTILNSIDLTIAESIIKHAKEWSADLIVLGTHGLRGIKRLMLGSDAETVVRHSIVPVLLVRVPNSEE